MEQMQALKKNQVLRRPVLSIRKENNRSYYVCDLGNGRTCDILMFPFQRKEEQPKEIDIFVKDIKESGPVLTQNTASLFNMFYEEGGIYTFQVEDYVPAYPKPYYRVRDHNGIVVKLSRFDDQTILNPREYISCRIVKISNSLVDLELVTERKENKSIAFRPLTCNGCTQGWLEKVNELLSKDEQLSYEHKCFARCVFRDADKSIFQVYKALDEYRSQRGEWIISLIEAMDLQLNEWMKLLLELNKQANRYSKDGFYLGLLKSYRHLCIYLLEDSDDVANIEDEEIRAGYQQILAQAARHASDYERAVELLTSEKEDAALQYAKSVLHKIEKSGFLLQPEERIHTLQSLFYLQPEIMDEVVPQFLWSIIGSRGIWEKEPFHSLVFGLLECYIDYNSEIIDTQGFDEDEFESNRLFLIIRTLSIVLLLANSSDNIDRLRYRELLYRFASYVPGADCEMLLDKAFYCLVNHDYEPLELSWQVIQLLNPVAIVTQLAMGKSTSFKGSYKVFQGKQGQVIIEDGSITVSTYDSELRQRKQLSCDMMPWHNVQLMSCGKPDGTVKPSAKEVDLVKYQTWWNYLDKCIFVFKSNVTQSKKTDNDNTFLEQDEILSKEELIELCRIIDRYAILQSHLKDTYNYVSLASMLVKLAGERWLYENYEARRRLLLSLYKFSAKETATVESTLKEFSDINLMVNTDSNTRKLVQEVRLVTCIGNSGMNQTLWELLHESVDEEVRKLSQLVLAYNMLEGIELRNGQQDELIERINAHLGIQITVPKAISMGEEGQCVEFKTSIVYPPSKTGKRRVALAEQTHEILREICGFLNAEGGTLMLGVNDYGRISGLETDLLHKEFNGSKDRYCRYLRDNIRLEMGPMAESLVTETVLDLAGRFVLAVRVRPCETPVLLRDNLWQRSGAETINRVGEVRAQFLRTRSDIYGQIDNARKFSTDWKFDIRQDRQDQHQALTVNLTPIQEVQVEPEKTQSLKHTFEHLSISRKREYQINTSLIRQKKINAGDIYPIFYLYLTEGEYYRTEADYDSNNEDVMLSLPVTGDDLEEDAWLVLVYEDATVLRVPVSSISGRDEWRKFKRYKEQKLFFAGIGSANDALVTVFKGNTTPQYRCDDIICFEEGGMQDNGLPLVTCKFQEMLYCEIVSRLSISGMRPGMYNPVKTTLGITVQAVGGDPERQTLSRAGIKTDF